MAPTLSHSISYLSSAHLSKMTTACFKVSHVNLRDRLLIKEPPPAVLEVLPMTFAGEEAGEAED